MATYRTLIQTIPIEHFPFSDIFAKKKRVQYLTLRKSHPDNLVTCVLSVSCFLCNKMFHVNTYLLNVGK